MLLSIFGMEGTDTGLGKGGSGPMMLSLWKLGWPCRELMVLQGCSELRQKGWAFALHVDLSLYVGHSGNGV